MLATQSQRRALNLLDLGSHVVVSTTSFFFFYIKCFLNCMLLIFLGMLFEVIQSLTFFLVLLSTGCRCPGCLFTLASFDVYLFIRKTKRFQLSMSDLGLELILIAFVRVY